MATHEGPADTRQYVRVSIDLPTNPKLAALNNPAACWAYVVSMTNCGASSSDGHFAMALVLRIAGATKKAGQALIDAGLWHVAGHDCPRCPQPEGKNAFLHDFLLHNRSAADVKKLSEKRTVAGKAGAAARWGKTSKTSDEGMAKRIPNAMAFAEQELWQTDGKAMAEERRTIPPAAGSASLAPPNLAVVGEEPRTAQQIVAWWIDRCGNRPPKRVTGHMAKQIADLLDEGIDPAYVRQGIAEWMTKEASPSLLPNLVNSAMNRQPAHPKQSQYATPASTAPDRIAPEEQCPQHRDQRAGRCRHCAARAKAGYVG